VVDLSIKTEVKKPHHKHAKLPKPAGGNWARNELALMGAPCAVIRELANKITSHFAGKWNIGFVDAEHDPQPKTDLENTNVHFNNRGQYVQLDLAAPLNPYSQRTIFDSCDLVLVNGNHAQAQQQVLIIHPGKSLEKKLERITDVQLVLLAEEGLRIPDYLQPIVGNAPQLHLLDDETILKFFEDYLQNQQPKLNGLVLIGGKSERMGTDKSLLDYHGKSQREHVLKMLQPFCEAAFLSCNATQSVEIESSKIEDRFLGIGPMGGILSAFQSAPDKAWLTVACDMPHLNTDVLHYLIEHRNPSKLATAFVNIEEGFPEPLLTIWEPKAYPVLLQALSMGISCPRKVLINSEIELLSIPNPGALKNVNDPEARQEVLTQFATKNT
jgi:molybdopterin-guanine dinucleotide biosynthesis protein A